MLATARPGRDAPALLLTLGPRYFRQLVVWAIATPTTTPLATTYASLW